MKPYTSAKGAQFRTSPSKILYLIGDINYCRIYLINGEVVLMSHTLKWYEDRWPSFLRIHKRVLINPTYAYSLHMSPHSRNNSHVIMDNQASLPIARRRLIQVQDKLSHLHIQEPAIMQES
ncbi:LytTR family transcriptional regulator DNA-binding domain-containing protein [Spirosoma gilvum]